MRIYDGSAYRDMTPEEEASFVEEMRRIEEEHAKQEPSVDDLLAALAALGVSV